MNKIAIFLSLAVALSLPVYADVRINIRADLTKGSVGTGDNDVKISWRGLEVEVEKEFKKNRLGLSGFAIGFRREPFEAFTGFGEKNNVQRWDEGTYLVFRTYRKYFLKYSLFKTWELNPGISVLYGIPGTTLDLTKQEGFGENEPYVHVFPLRNIGVPRFPIKEAGLLYPELSVALRKKMIKDLLNVEVIGGLRMIRLGVVEADISEAKFNKTTSYLPSVGIRFGVKF